MLHHGGRNLSLPPLFRWPRHVLAGIGTDRPRRVPTRWGSSAGGRQDARGERAARGAVRPLASRRWRGEREMAAYLCPPVSEEAARDIGAPTRTRCDVRPGEALARATQAVRASDRNGGAERCELRLQRPAPAIRRRE